MFGLNRFTRPQHWLWLDVYRRLPVNGGLTREFVESDKASPVASSWRLCPLASFTARSPDAEILCGRNFDSPLPLVSAALHLFTYRSESVADCFLISRDPNPHLEPSVFPLGLHHVRQLIPHNIGVHGLVKPTQEPKCRGNCLLLAPASQVAIADGSLEQRSLTIFMPVTSPKRS